MYFGQDEMNNLAQASADRPFRYEIDNTAKTAVEIFARGQNITSIDSNFTDFSCQLKI